MTFAPRLLILLAIASLLATACGEDSDNGGGSNDTGSTSSSDGTSGTSGSDGTSGGTSGADGTSGGDDAVSDTSGSTSGDTSGTTAFDCAQVPTEANKGQTCDAANDCTAVIGNQVLCGAPEQGQAPVCQQPCVVGTCTDMCASGESCLPVGDQGGNPVLYPGTTDKYLGACVIPPALDCSQIGTAAQVDQECSQSNNTCEAGASACIVTQQGATTGNCKQLCSPGKCTDMCTAGKTCQGIGQNFPDGSPIGVCVP